jgi:hypothetical protein
MIVQIQVDAREIAGLKAPHPSAALWVHEFKHESMRVCAKTMQSLLSPAADMPPHWLWAVMC